MTSSNWCIHKIKKIFMWCGSWALGLCQSEQSPLSATLFRPDQPAPCTEFSQCQFKEREYNQNVNLQLTCQRKFKSIEGYYPALVKTEKSTPAPALGPVCIQNSDSGPVPAPTKISDSCQCPLRYSGSMITSAIHYRANSPLLAK